MPERSSDDTISVVQIAELAELFDLFEFSEDFDSLEAQTAKLHFDKLASLHYQRLGRVLVGVTKDCFTANLRTRCRAYLRKN